MYFGVALGLNTAIGLAGKALVLSYIGTVVTVGSVGVLLIEALTFYDKLSENTLRARKLHIAQDRRFSNFVDHHVLQENTEQGYPNEKILVDRELHRIFLDYKGEVQKARGYITQLTPSAS